MVKNIMLIYNMLKQILIIFSSLGLLCAQIQYGGTPEYFDVRYENINFITIDKTNIVDRGFHPMVFQFGDEYDVDINVLESATIIENNNQSIYLLGIESRDAFAIGLNFNEFILTENSSLFFYDEDRTNYLGSFNDLNNKETLDLTTALIKSDRIIIELSIPTDDVENVNLNIDTIIHDYTDINNYYDMMENALQLLKLECL